MNDLNWCITVNGIDIYDHVSNKKVFIKQCLIDEAKKVDMDHNKAGALSASKRERQELDHTELRAKHGLKYLKSTILKSKRRLKVYKNWGPIL